MNSPSISIQHAQLRYGEQVLFHNLNCILPAGQTTCLLGQSGIGKSSLLRLIAGLDAQGSHTHQSAHISTSDEISLHERIAYMAQTDLLLPWLSTLENVLLGYRLRRTYSDRLKSKAEVLLTEVGLGEALHKRPAELSGGMRQRAALVRTLLEDKPIVLMDEPFSALDTTTRLRLQTLAAHLLQNRTVLLITHDPLEALRLGHHILVMQGQPAQIETALTLEGMPPRAVTDKEVLYWQGELLQKLLAIHGETKSR
jgi:putative hydroxymethylpyrimidine transport system ATP-binding protein